MLAIVGGAVAIGVAVNVVAARNQSNDRATPARCRPAHPAYGAPPGGLSYVSPGESLRRRTLRALHIRGRADVRLVQRSGVTYGEVVGVPTRDPLGYVDHVVREANGHAKAGPGYSLIPYGKREVVAVGARGCRAVYVAAATPDDVRLLSAAVFSG